MTHLEAEIQEVEARLAAGRAEYHREFDEYKDRVREQATSFTSLAGLVVVGFLAGSLIRRRPAAANNTPPAMSIVNLLASLLPVVARVREERRRSAVEQHLLAHGRTSPGEGFLAVEQARGGAT